MHRRHDRCPLDPEPPYQAPEQWDAPHVQHRFADAIGTLTRLPLHVLARLSQRLRRHDGALCATD